MQIDSHIKLQFRDSLTSGSWTDFSGGITENTMHLEKMIVKDEISFGVMYASKFEGQIHNIDADDYSDKWIRVVKRVDSTDTPIFTGRVESSSKDYIGAHRDLVAYDIIYYMRSTNVAGWWNQYWRDHSSATLANILTSLLSYVGLTVASATASGLSSLPNASVSITDEQVEDYTKITFEDVIHSITELMGVFPTINGAGEFELIKLNPSQTAVTVGSGDIELASSYYEDYETYYINRIDVYLTSEEIYKSVGQGNNGYPVSGNIFILAKQDDEIVTIANAMLSAINNIKFVPCEVKLILSNFDLQLGQKVTAKVEGTYSYVFSAVYSGVQLVDETIGADARGLGIEQKASGINNERILRSTVGDVGDKTGAVSQATITQMIDAAVGHATDMITGGMSSYVFLVQDSNGCVTDIAIADEPGVDALGHPIADNIWRWNSGGLGFSSTGWNGNFATAITNDGSIVANMITTGTLNADVLSASSIYVGSGGATQTIGEAVTTAQQTASGAAGTASQALTTAQGSVQSTDVEFNKNQDPETAPTTGWDTNPPTWEEGYYIWQRTKFMTANYNPQNPQQGTYWYSDPVCITGSPGHSAVDVKLHSVIPSVHSVVKNEDGTFTPGTVTFTATETVGDNPPGGYNGVYEISTSIDGTNYSQPTTIPASGVASSASYTIPVGSVIKYIRCKLYSSQAKTAVLDQQAVPVISNGSSIYTFVRYSANADGNPMVSEPTATTKYIGLYTGYPATEVMQTSRSSWNTDSATRYYYYGDTSYSSLVRGAYNVIFDGTKYDGCQSGTDGSNIYVGNLRLKSTSAQDTGEPFLFYSYSSTSAIYVWVKTSGTHKWTLNRITSGITVPGYTSFTWSKYMGDDGAPGEPGDDGVTLYTWIRYADDDQGTNMSNSPVGKKYIGIAYNKITPTESDIASDYVWSKYVGEDGTSSTSYSLIVSHAAITRQKNGSYNPGSISVSAKKQTGTSAMGDYSGWFKIETTTDNTSWNTIYPVPGTTQVQESSHSQNISSLASNVIAIRCSLYSTSGMSASALLDMQTVPIVVDGDDAYTVIFTNENYTFSGDTVKAVVGQADAVCNVRVLKGANQIACDVPTSVTLPSTGLVYTRVQSGTATRDAQFRIGISTDASKPMTLKTGTINIDVSVENGAKTFTKTFSFSLALTGSSGSSATTYHLTSSVNAIVKTGDTLNPSTVTFSAESHTGSDTPTAYSGMFVVHESADGINWGNSPQTGTGSSYIYPPTGSSIGATTKYIRCRLYDSQGDTLLDSQTVAVVSDGLDGENFNWNLAEHTATYEDWIKSGVTVQDDSPTKDLYVSNGNASWYIAEAYKLMSPYADIRDKTVTLSFMVKGNSSASSNSNVLLEIDLVPSATDGTRLKYRQETVSFRLTTSWQKVTKTITITDSSFPAHSGDGSPTYSTCYYRLIFGTLSASTGSATTAYRVRELKLEIGSEATAWAPARNDALGEDAYTVILSNESHTFSAGTTTAVATSINVSVEAYKGSSRIGATIGTITGTVTGKITATVDSGSNGTTSAFFTVAVTNTMDIANGILTIPITIDGHEFTKEFTYSLAFKGADASTYYVSPSTNAMIRDPNNNNSLTPTSVTFTAYQKSGAGAASTYTGKFIIQQSSDGTNWDTGTNTMYTSGNVTNVTYPGSTGKTILGTTKYIRCQLYQYGGTTTLLDSETVTIITAGEDGGDGYTVILGNENHTFPGNAEKAIIGGEAECTATVFKGTSQISYTIDPIQNVPSGLQATRSDSNTKVTFKVVSPSFNSGGTVTIPIVADGKTFNKVFTYSVALAGDSFAWNLLKNTDTFPMPTVEIPGYSNCNGKGVWRVASGGNGTMSTFALTDSPIPQLYKGISITGNTSGNRDAVQDGIPVVNGKTYTASGYARKHAGQSANITAQFRIWRYASGVNANAGNTFSFTVSSSEWAYFSGQITTSTITGTETAVSFLAGIAGAGSIDFCGLKLEEGDTASGWAPAEDDLSGYTVYLTNDNYTFAGDSNKAVPGQDPASCEVYAYKGTTQIACTVPNNVVLPLGLVYTKGSDGTESAPGSFTIGIHDTTAMTSKTGIVAIDIVADGKTFRKLFSFSVAMDGNDGSFTWNQMRETEFFNGWTAKGTNVGTFDNFTGIFTFPNITATSQNSWIEPPANVPYSNVRNKKIVCFMEFKAAANSVRAVKMEPFVTTMEDGAYMRYRNVFLNDGTSDGSSTVKVTATGDWQRVYTAPMIVNDATFFNQGSGTVDYATAYFGATISVWHADSTDLNKGEFQIRRPKIEVSEMVTDWTPAKEDLKGADGTDGVSIDSIKEIYYASDSDIVPEPPRSEDDMGEIIPVTSGMPWYRTESGVRGENITLEMSVGSDIVSDRHIVHTGRNLLRRIRKGTYTEYGILCTYNDDGSVTLNGKPSGTGDAYIFVTAYKDDFYELAPLRGREVIFSIQSTPTNSNIGVYVSYNTVGSSAYQSIFSSNTTKTHTFSIPDTIPTESDAAVALSCGIRVKNSATLNDLTVKPMLRLSADSSTTWEEFTYKVKKVSAAGTVNFTMHAGINHFFPLESKGANDYSSGLTMIKSVYNKWMHSCPVWTSVYRYFFTSVQVNYSNGITRYTQPVSSATYDGFGAFMDEYEDVVEELQQTMASEAQVMELQELLYSHDNSGVFKAFRVDTDGDEPGVHIQYYKSDDNSGEIYMNGEQIYFKVNGQTRAFINADGFNFDYGLLTTALTIGGGTNDSTKYPKRQWTWMKAQSGHFRLVYTKGE